MHTIHTERVEDREKKMDTSEGLELLVVGGSGAADGDCSTPGSIVWVRRRNGSWWPGKILGPEELSPTHIMSPRSGTPVKLLGREDASVDWYNLEKSRRVKAFRCGDFDECIDKAEKSLGVPIKKREKYARREDAILHALELEREQLEKTQKKLVKPNSAGTRKSAAAKRELATSSLCLGNDDEKFVNHRPHSPTKGLEDHDTLYSQKGKYAKQSSCEEDKPEVMPRMRGLQDFGLRIAPKRKAIDNHDHPLRSGKQSMGDAASVIGTKALLPFKRKRNQSGLLEESSVKRRDRRRPLHQVLQSSAKLPLQSDGDVSSSMQREQEVSGVVCRAKRSRCVYLPAESNGSLDHTTYHDEMQIIPPQFVDNSGSLTEEATTSGLMDETESDSSRSDTDTEEEHAVLSDTLQRRTTPRGARQTESMSSEEDDDLDQLPMSHTRPHTKWQLKGKRNMRNQPEKRPNGGFIHETYLEERKPNRRVKKKSRLDFDYADEVFDEMPGGLDSDEDPVWEPEAPYYDQDYDHLLVDVELKVQASYQGGSHVPLVSLMSKLNGKAIIGHPVQVEATRIGGGDVFKEPPLPPMWTTGRRSATHRIPRAATLCGGGGGGGVKKALKKVSLSSQKTRTLSSIGVEQGGGKKKSRVDGAGLIRATTVTCIPVKLVFSRLLEAVGRPKRR